MSVMTETGLLQVKEHPAVLHFQSLHMPAGDAIRPFLLHAYGGLYMDVDVECFDATDDMVDGFDLVSMPGQPQQCCPVIIAFNGNLEDLCLAGTAY